MYLDIDIETYSTVDLTKYGVYAYVQDPEFRILMAGWALGDGDVEVATTEAELAALDDYLLDPTIEKEAHNAQFERVCFSEYLRRRGKLGPDEWLPPEQWHDTAAVAVEHGYPGKLETVAKWLGGEQKDSAGSALIRWFCVPDRTGKRRLPEDHPEKWSQFVEYCRQDVVTHREVRLKLGTFPTPHEREVWNVDQRINDRGVRIDLDLARAAVNAAEHNKMVQELEVSALTGVVNPGSNDQMLAWLRSEGFKVTNMQAETVRSLLKRDDLTPAQRRVLELRQELALAASSKYRAALGGVSYDGRLRGQFRFFGAHTGRWAGRGVQLHNLPRLGMTKLDADGNKVHDELGESMAILDLKMGAETSSDVLKRLVRPMLLGPLTVADLNAIEARVLAWLAGEEWVLEAFRGGRDIYVETAERMSTPNHKMSRFEGKVAVLALGYNGGVNSLRAMGADGSDEALQKLVSVWRRANPNIVSLWREMQAAFKDGGEIGAGLVTVETDGRDRMLRLPSGRAITYHYCKWEWEPSKYGSGKDLVASFRDPGRGFPVRTYGGRLVENITQAVARDILAHALVEMDKAGLPVVGHVHDEVLVEGEREEEVVRLLTTTPDWAAGLPVGAAAFTCQRYRKD